MGRGTRGTQFSRWLPLGSPLSQDALQGLLANGQPRPGIFDHGHSLGALLWKSGNMKSQAIRGSGPGRGKAFQVETPQNPKHRPWFSSVSGFLHFVPWAARIVGADRSPADWAPNPEGHPGVEEQPGICGPIEALPSQVAVLFLRKAPHKNNIWELFDRESTWGGEIWILAVFGELCPRSVSRECYLSRETNACRVHSPRTPKKLTYNM